MGLVDGKAGVVTGAANGIGRATAILLGAEGAAVVVSDLEAQASAARETVELIEQAGGQAVFAAADVVESADHQRLVETCVAEFGALDFAHNNVGINIDRQVDEFTEDEWDRIVEVNLKGVWLGIRHQLPQMRRQRSGSIINTASAAGLVAMPGKAAYIASKHAVIGLTKAAAIDAGDFGIRVNAVCPTATSTPMLEASGYPPSRVAALVGRHTIKRLSEPNETAEAVTWLASDRSSSVTGSAFTVDLGITAGFSTPTPD
jgi:NAD(P)-dependent dehydrogenase (short-subunit alcohol dehydrogenase family)